MQALLYVVVAILFLAAASALWAVLEGVTASLLGMVFGMVALVAFYKGVEHAFDQAVDEGGASPLSMFKRRSQRRRRTTKTDAVLGIRRRGRRR